MWTLRASLNAHIQDIFEPVQLGELGVEGMWSEFKQRFMAAIGRFAQFIVAAMDLEQCAWALEAS